MKSRFANHDVLVSIITNRSTVEVRMNDGIRVVDLYVQGALRYTLTEHWLRNYYEVTHQTKPEHIALMFKVL